MQYPQNYKYQDVNQSHFRKPLQAFTKAVKNYHPEAAHTFLKGCTIFSYFLPLNCYNFGPALTKSIKINFLDIVLSLSKLGKILIPIATEEETTVL